MRRWVLLVMLVLLPMEFASAAAAMYCRHETGQAAKHFGHHEHRHHVVAKAAADSNGDQGSVAGGAHVDCEYCQLAAAQLLAPVNAVLEHVLPSRLVYPPSASTFDSLHPTQPDRPNWTRADPFGEGDWSAIS